MRRREPAATRIEAGLALLRRHPNRIRPSCVDLAGLRCISKPGVMGGVAG
jgi:hypothetical protein